MAKGEVGLRELKKQRTRQAIFETAHRLFKERGFDAVTVAEIARAAEVSEVTVFNYFPTKEDLFYGGMQFFEEKLLDAVRTRREGESALDALRCCLLESASGLAGTERVATILDFSRIISCSPSLLTRERDIVDRYTQQLADLLAAETGAEAGDVEALSAATALMGAHRTLVKAVRRLVADGRQGDELVVELRRLIRAAYGRLEKGLAGYPPPAQG